MAKNNYLIEIQILIGNCYNLTEKNVVPNLEKTDVFDVIYGKRFGRSFGGDGRSFGVRPNSILGGSVVHYF